MLKPFIYWMRYGAFFHEICRDACMEALLMLDPPRPATASGRSTRIL